MDLQTPIIDRHSLEHWRPQLYPKQEAAIFDPRRISLIEASTKAGKTSGCIVWLVEEAMRGNPGQNYWWVAPVNSQADIAFRRALRAIPKALRTMNITLKTITLVCGTVIWFKSGDHPDALFGDDVKACVIDEASRLKQDSWYAVRSTLTATRGKIRIVGNVKGRRNWFFEMARRAQMGDDPTMGYHKLIAADAVAAGVLHADEVAAAKRQLPDHVFRELYLAEASDDSGNPFGLDAIKKCVKPLSKKKPRAWGWDLAKYNDWTVGTALDEDSNTCQHERWQLPWGETMTRIHALTGNTPALVDSTGVGDPIVEMLQKKAGTKFEGYGFTGPSKQKLMEGLAVAIHSQDIGYPEGVVVLELEAFEYEYKPSGVRYSAPEGFHDDCVCSLALAKMHKMRSPAPFDYKNW